MHYKSKCPALIISIIMFLFILSFAKTSLADGMYFKERLIPNPGEVSKLIHSPNQKAVIFWDPESKKETMIISTTAKSEDLANLCWLVPIRSTGDPTVKEFNFNIFTDIAKEFAPKISMPVYGFGISYGWGLGYHQGVVIPGVIEIDFEEIDIYDLYILYVTNSQTLLQWLHDHGFFVPDGAVDVFEEYTKDGCYFIANRIDLFNKHAGLLNALEKNLPDLLLELMEGKVTIDRVIWHVNQRILADAGDSVTYDTSIAGYFIDETEYTNTGKFPYLSNEANQKIFGKFSGLKKTINDLRSGIATPLSFEFFPSEEVPIYPLILTSLVPGEIHIEVYIIAPYKVFDLNGILTYDPPLSDSEIKKAASQNTITNDPFISFIWDFYYMPYYENEKEYKVFLSLPHYLESKITGEYGISLPQGDLWGTRMVYKGKAGYLKKDAMFINIWMKDYYINDGNYPVPDLFEMGPLYAQIFEPYRYLFVADLTGTAFKSNVNGETFECSSVMDLMLNPDNFLLAQDPKDPNDPVVKYWTDLGADPNLFGENDPNIAGLFDRDQFIVDLGLPIFADQNLRFKGSQAELIKSSGTLDWFSTVGGYGANGIKPFLLQPLEVYPYDGMPTYLPAYYRAIDVIKTSGKPYYSPELVFLLEGALWNSNITAWPNIAALEFTPQYFEDIIVTIEVTNGMNSDARTFPISVVEYPVENYPPVLQLDIEDQTFYVGKVNEYLINFIDPDCFIFCKSPDPKTSHVPGFPISEDFRTDMDELCRGLTLNYIDHDYCGPWVEDGPTYGLINPSTGLIRWSPEFKGIYEAVITCSDARGGTVFGEITIECIYPPQKNTYYQTPISPALYLFPFLTGSPLVSPGSMVYQPYGLFGHVYTHSRDVLKMMYLPGFPLFYQGVSGIQYFFHNESRNAFNGTDLLIGDMPWWAY